MTIATLIEKFQEDISWLGYNETEREIIEHIKRAITLLKEQEAIPVDTKVIGTFNGDVEVYCCRDCRTILDPAFHYCPNCGQEVKWE